MSVDVISLQQFYLRNNPGMESLRTKSSFSSVLCSICKKTLGAENSSILLHKQEKELGHLFHKKCFQNLCIVNRNKDLKCPDSQCNKRINQDSFFSSLSVLEKINITIRTVLLYALPTAAIVGVVVQGLNVVDRMIETRVQQLAQRAIEEFILCIYEVNDIQLSEEGLNGVKILMQGLFFAKIWTFVCSYLEPFVHIDRIKAMKISVLAPTLCLAIPIGIQAFTGLNQASGIKMGADRAIRGAKVETVKVQTAMLIGKVVIPTLLLTRVKWQAASEAILRMIQALNKRGYRGKSRDIIAYLIPIFCRSSLYSLGASFLATGIIGSIIESNVWRMWASTFRQG